MPNVDDAGHEPAAASPQTPPPAPTSPPVPPVAPPPAAVPAPAPAPSWPPAPAPAPAPAAYGPPAMTPPPPPPTMPSVPPAGPAADAPLTRPQRQGRPRTLVALAVAFLLSISAFLGYTLGNDHSSSSPSLNTSSAFTPNQGSSSSNGNSQNVADSVLPSVVNINTTLDNGAAAGTGIVLTADGLVLTNNHVIADSTSVSVAINGNDNDMHDAKVLGYDVADDVALIQVQGVSNLQPASIGSASSLSVGDAILAIGNAGGQGGTPSVVSGNVTALDQQITATDQDGSNAETLSNLVQVNANVEPGDSGGPLVDANGKVVGMTSAASSSNGGFGFGRFGDQGGNEGYAIPIENALTIAKKIQSGSSTSSIHIGGSRALLGVSVSDSTNANGFNSGSSSSSGSGSGAAVQDVQSGSAADGAGIQAGDLITGIGDTKVSSASELTHAMVAFSPKDKVEVQWVDSSGQSHHASVVLGSGPPA